MSLYKELKLDYDRVYGTEKFGDLGKETQQGLESAQDEVRSTGTGNRSTISNWEMDGNLWSRKGKEDSSRAGHAAQPEMEMPEWSAYVHETSTFSRSPGNSEGQSPDNLEEDQLPEKDEERSGTPPGEEDWNSPAKDKVSKSPEATSPDSGEMRLQEM